VQTTRSPLADGRHGAGHLRYIAVEGPIGVGKTTLTRRLAKSIGATAILEDAANNPFLQEFYQRPERAALPVQLHFLMTRRAAMQRVTQARVEEPDAESSWVSDFLFSKDRLFASLTLDEKQYALYSEIAAELDFELVLPDLVVYLQAPLEVLYDRIENRGNGFEQSIASSYLARLQRAYTDFFYSYNETPLLIVNASEIDFAQNEQDYAGLVEQIMSTEAGRHYFNPSSAAAPAA
jgi:deoxyadenosine/deoxycytidine kinase